MLCPVGQIAAKLQFWMGIKEGIQLRRSNDLGVFQPILQTETILKESIKHVLLICRDAILELLHPSVPSLEPGELVLSSALPMKTQVAEIHSASLSKNIEICFLPIVFQRLCEDRTFVSVPPVPRGFYSLADAARFLNAAFCCLAVFASPVK